MESKTVLWRTALLDEMSGGVFFTLDNGDRLFVADSDFKIMLRDEYNRLVDYYEWRSGERYTPPKFSRKTRLAALRSKVKALFNI